MTPRVRRAVGLVLLGAVLAVTCTFLGRWQWHRHVARDARIQVVEQNYDAAPVPLTEVLPSPSTRLTAGDEWRQVSVSGRYEAQSTVLLRNRPVESTAGYHVLVPFVTDPDGAVLLVDRGFVPMGADGSSEVDVPTPPAGQVTVTVRLRQDEPALGRPSPAGQVQSITVDEVLAAGDVPTDGATDAGAYRAYGSLVSEDPAPATALVALPVPSTDPGSHLSYAFQWWTFALGSFVGFAWFARRELHEEDEVDGPDDGAPDPDAPSAPAPRPSTAPRPSPAPRRRPSAEDEEDALLDAQQG
ncbi:SURF1 family protein [Cellulomonas sp. P22]|uniref:SURF1 family cytochrome oxidase biogenesis protein n=1 Tax=Cellulomonas sp. P22 TaxID=3373189 RepID=UPI00378D16A0